MSHPSVVQTTRPRQSVSVRPVSSTLIVKVNAPAAPKRCTNGIAVVWFAPLADRALISTLCHCADRPACSSMLNVRSYRYPEDVLVPRARTSLESNPPELPRGSTGACGGETVCRSGWGRAARIGCFGEACPIVVLRTFWSVEGLHVSWPGGEAALPVLAGFYVAVALTFIVLQRRRLFGRAQEAAA